MSTVEKANTNTPALSVYSLKSADDLVRRFTEVHTARQTIERQWKMNLSFYKGQQYVYWNNSTNRLESIPTNDGDKPRHRVRITANKILPGVQSQLAKFTKTRPVARATPANGDDSSIKAAQVAELLLEQKHLDLDLDEKLQDAILWSLICSAGYVMTTWDAQAGTPLEFVVGPDGKPITDDFLRQAFLTRLEEQGIDRKNVTKTTYVGEVRCDVISPFDVFPDPSAKNFNDARWVIVRRAMDPDEIKDRYGVECDGDAMAEASSMPLMLQRGPEDKYRMKLRNVYHGYFLPTPGMKKGRIVCWIEGPNTILSDGPWNFPMRELPLVKWHGTSIPGTQFDTTPVEHAIPLQKQLNRTLSQIVEHQNIMLRPQFMAPVGSLRTRLSTEPGAVFEYTPIGNLMPQPIQIPSIPMNVFEHLKDMEARIDEIFTRADVLQGQVPPNVEAGVAIELLQETASDMLEPTIRLNERSYAQLGQQILALCQQFYTEPRLLLINGSGSQIKVKRFCNADIPGKITIRCEVGSSIPRSRAGRVAQIEKWVAQGIIRPDRAWRFLDSADMKRVAEGFMADEDLAEREHEKLIQGIPTNARALQEAQEQLQQSGGQLNPDTQQPWQGQDELQDWLESKAFGPTEFEDWGLHIEQHSLFMKGVEFDGLPIDVQERFVTHLNLTRHAFFNLPRQPDKINSPNVNLQIKSTIGPTAAAQVLNRAGVFDVTPQEMQEPPLETWVTSDTSEPVVGNGGNVAGNNPVLMENYQQHEQEMQMQQQAQQNQGQQLQQAQQAQQAQQNQQQSQEQHSHGLMAKLQQQRQQEITHAMQTAAQAQQMRHAEEKHKQSMTQPQGGKVGPYRPRRSK